MNPSQIQDVIKPLCWLIGTWKSVSAKAYYPTMKTVMYNEILRFTFTGQPTLDYSVNTWKPEDKSPMHLERGFLRTDESGCLVVLLTAQNFGVSTLEEGIVAENLMKLDSRVIANSKYAKKRVVALQRVYSLNEKGQLIFKCKIQTEKIPLTPHLDCLYDKED
ncbi:hypothetical protein JTB14_013796 [Gonioctena quinquepunctata]|nr:hypothetical protein JTB14_013796 [Gonioctena quinquepunctata]